MLEIKVKYFTDIEPLKFIENKSDWYDLRSAEDIELKAGEHELYLAMMQGTANLDAFTLIPVR